MRVSSRLAVPKFLLLGLVLCLTIAGCGSTAARGATTPTGTAAPVVPCAPGAPITAPPLAGSPQVATVGVPNAPFGTVATADGQWLFASLHSTSASNPTTGIAVLRREGVGASLQHVIALGPNPSGMALTHDGHYLIVADDDAVAVLDVTKVEGGAANAVVATIPTGETALTLEVSVSLDDTFVFATDEHETPPYVRGDLTVIDLQQVLAGKAPASAVVGQAPLDYYPVGMALSPDGSTLYLTSRFWVSPSADYVPSPNEVDTGSLTVVDVARAEHDPSHAVVAHALAGCGPVRVVLSPTGDVAWVSAQQGNAVLAFATSKLTSDPTHAQLAAVSVCTAPTGLALSGQGRFLLVACSNRFTGANATQSIEVLDTQHALGGASALVGSVGVGAFPREVSVAGTVAVVTNYDSGSLSLINTSTFPA